ncbi:hypothetical protein [Desulfobaculum bizertense]|uniref:Response regulatory domain-containing protein n=1 Tax=Desulfobaculum bizertense DSM 18034 TaxID=1121442 RepID=A0A1T4VXN0_9BACT|nr:hypothetical protein [Desulfobaculum bizertense]UIJ36946.1 hypothetical protein LWC08_09365 [Desulfobaculum bizertense]SKA69744.1 hypothetical protein SAMN02745702_01210 [Desulfobaculum bizertense DSM 18034]
MRVLIVNTTPNERTALVERLTRLGIDVDFADSVRLAVHFSHMMRYSAAIFENGTPTEELERLYLALQRRQPWMKIHLQNRIPEQHDTDDFVARIAPQRSALNSAALCA